MQAAWPDHFSRAVGSGAAGEAMAVLLFGSPVLVKV